MYFHKCRARLVKLKTLILLLVSKRKNKRDPLAQYCTEQDKTQLIAWCATYKFQPRTICPAMKKEFGETPIEFKGLRRLLKEVLPENEVDVVKTQLGTLKKQNEKLKKVNKNQSKQICGLQKELDLLKKAFCLHETPQKPKRGWPDTPESGPKKRRQAPEKTEKPKKRQRIERPEIDYITFSISHTNHEEFKTYFVNLNKPVYDNYVRLATENESLHYFLGNPLAYIITNRPKCCYDIAVNYIKNLRPGQN